MKALAAGLSLILCAATANAATLQNWNYNAWVIGAYSNDQTGQFSHCGMSASYRNGTMLLFTIARDFTEVDVGFSNLSWNFVAGQTYNVTLKIDNLWLQTARGVAIDAHLIKFPFGSNGSPLANFIEEIKRGRLLTVTSEQDTLYFSLKDTYHAYEQVRQCVQSRMTSAPNSGPFAPDAAPSPFVPDGKHPSIPTTASPSAQEMVNYFFSLPEMSSFHIDNSLRDKLTAYQVMWRSTNGIGGLTRSTGAVDDGIGSDLAQDERECRGKLATAKQDKTLPNGGMVRQVFTACDDPELYIYRDFVPFKDGSFYEWTFIGTAGGVAADDERTFFSALTSVVSAPGLTTSH